VKVFRHPLRICGRLLWLSGIIVFALVEFPFRCAFRKNFRRARALWLQRHCRRTLKMFGLKPQIFGEIPERGFLISNHLGYLDIPVLSSITPAVFVSKREVKFWPVFGQFAQMAGTLFVDRERRMQVGHINSEIQKVLDSGTLVVLFPEGKSSNGETILPFRSALLEPAAGQRHHIFVVSVQYALDDGDAGEEICYWGDDTFFPHMLNLLGKCNVRAIVRFAPFTQKIGDRKELARQLREAVLKLKNQNPC
jgi:1-acyl-sn-glycerol-3-phosphate acyltransferase